MTRSALQFTVRGDTYAVIQKLAVEQTAAFLELADPVNIDSHADIQIDVEDLKDSEQKYQATVYVRIKK
jgi:hypothetical protein